MGKFLSSGSALPSGASLDLFVGFWSYWGIIKTIVNKCKLSYTKYPLFIHPAHTNSPTAHIKNALVAVETEHKRHTPA